jgi:hypothetical protein
MGSKPYLARPPVLAPRKVGPPQRTRVVALDQDGEEIEAFVRHEQPEEAIALVVDLLRARAHSGMSQWRGWRGTLMAGTHRLDLQL